MLSCSIWFSALSFWMGGGLESRCVGRVCCADGAVRPPYLLTPWCRVLLENLTGLQLVKKFPALY